MKKWFAVYTRPRFEKKIEKYLTDRNIICYLPMVKLLRQWTDRKKWVEMPLFSSYIFVRVDEQDYVEVLKAPGTVRYITFEGNAVEISDKEIENIKWVLSSEITAEPIDTYIPKGEKVEIVKGPLRGLIAEMVTYNNKNIIVVRLDQLERSFEIILPANHVKLL
jgi:transcriptional antiterminator RfaH